MNELIKKYSKLKGFVQHGVVFNREVETDKGVILLGDCPFCGKKNKFDSYVDTTVWGCKRCGISGNLNDFFKLRAETYSPGFKGKIATNLAKHRQIKPSTLRSWGVGWSGEFYTLRAYTSDLRRVSDIERYFPTTKRGFSTQGSKKGLFKPLKTYNSQRVWLLEGLWDPAALWECLQKLEIEEDCFGLQGAGSFPSAFANLFQGKDVIVILDNDDAGLRGMNKISNVLTGIANSMQFMHWVPGLKEGLDFRDMYIKFKRDATKTVKYIERHLKADPPELPGMITESKNGNGKSLGTTPDPEGEGMSAEQTYKEYGKWLHLTETELLEVMFGTMFANRIDGDPVWMFIVGPAGSSKSEMIMSLHSSPLVVPITTFTENTLVSGANTMGSGDPSLIPRLNGKVMAMKDFTTILSHKIDTQKAIFGYLREAYDGELHKQFGNGISRSYHSKFGIIAGVTPVIEEHAAKQSVLGERFIKYRIKSHGRVEVGEEIIRRALQNITKEGAMRSGLREVAFKVLDRQITPDDTPEIPEEYLEKILKLAQWTATLRGSVSRDKYTQAVNFKPTPEVGTRLAKQLATLGLGISIYKQEKAISESTYNTLVSVAQDTAPGRVEDTVKQLFLHAAEGDGWFKTGEIARWTRYPDTTLRYVLADLNLLHIVSVRNQRWKLSNSVLKIMVYLDMYKKERMWRQDAPKAKKRKMFKRRNPK